MNSKSGPNLGCPSNDSFSVTTANGNGKLVNAIGLITMDEANMAGSTINANNLLYYLYSGTDYWTMSPSTFGNWFIASNFRISSFGLIGNTEVYQHYGVRPVINIDTSKITFTGVGTKENPYNIEIK